jgi:hypothetical protein
MTIQELKAKISEILERYKAGEVNTPDDVTKVTDAMKETLKSLNGQQPEKAELIEEYHHRMINIHVDEPNNEFPQLLNELHEKL